MSYARRNADEPARKAQRAAAAAGAFLTGENLERLALERARAGTRTDWALAALQAWPRLKRGALLPPDRITYAEAGGILRAAFTAMGWVEKNYSGWRAFGMPSTPPWFPPERDPPWQPIPYGALISPDYDYFVTIGARSMTFQEWREWHGSFFPEAPPASSSWVTVRGPSTGSGAGPSRAWRRASRWPVPFDFLDEPTNTQLRTNDVWHLTNLLYFRALSALGLEDAATAAQESRTAGAREARAKKRRRFGPSLPEQNPLTRFRNDHVDHHHGQDDYVLWALDGDEKLGLLAYSFFRDDIHINMVKTREDLKRQGVGRALFMELIRLWPDAAIHPGLQTPEGAALWKNVAPEIRLQRRLRRARQRARRNPDERMRDLERRAAAGDDEAAEKLRAMRTRSGQETPSEAFLRIKEGDTVRFSLGTRGKVIHEREAISEIEQRAGWQSVFLGGEPIGTPTTSAVIHYTDHGPKYQAGVLIFTGARVVLARPGAGRWLPIKWLAVSPSRRA